jgi:hypothetical protein
MLHKHFIAAAASFHKYLLAGWLTAAHRQARSMNVASSVERDKSNASPHKWWPLNILHGVAGSTASCMLSGPVTGNGSVNLLLWSSHARRQWDAVIAFDSWDHASYLRFLGLIEVLRWCGLFQDVHRFLRCAGLDTVSSETTALGQ